MKRTFVFAIGLAVVMSTAACRAEDQTGFEAPCDAFGALEEHGDASSQTSEANAAFIDRELRKRSVRGPAATTWAAVKSAVAEQRYGLIRDAAQATLHREWSCSAVQRLAPAAGY